MTEAEKEAAIAEWVEQESQVANTLAADDLGVNARPNNSIDGGDITVEGNIDNIHDKAADETLVPTTFEDAVREISSDVNNEVVVDIEMSEEDIEMALIEESITIGKFKEPGWEDREEEE